MNFEIVRLIIHISRVNLYIVIIELCRSSSNLWQTKDFETVGIEILRFHLYTMDRQLPKSQCYQTNQKTKVGWSGTTSLSVCVIGSKGSFHPQDCPCGREWIARCGPRGNHNLLIAQCDDWLAYTGIRQPVWFTASFRSLPVIPCGLG